MSKEKYIQLNPTEGLVVLVPKDSISIDENDNLNMNYEVEVSNPDINDEQADTIAQEALKLFAKEIMDSALEKAKEITDENAWQETNLQL